MKEKAETSHELDHSALLGGTMYCYERFPGAATHTTVQV